MGHHFTNVLRALTFRFCAVAGLLAASMACDRPPCPGGHPPSHDANAPKLLSVAVLSQDSEDPWSLAIEVLFEAPNGNASEGQLEVFVGAGTPIILPLRPYFGPSNVALDAKSGRLAIPLHLSSNAVQDDSLVRLGLQLADGNRLYSNCSTIELHVLVDIVGARPVTRSSRYASLVPRTRP